MGDRLRIEGPIVRCVISGVVAVDRSPSTSAVDTVESVNDRCTDGATAPIDSWLWSILLSVLARGMSKLCERCSTSRLLRRLPESRRTKLDSDSVGRTELFDLAPMPCFTLENMRRLMDFCRSIRDVMLGGAEGGMASEPLLLAVGLQPRGASI
jgi:hypothetical protein